jgi:hypothetical protein
MKYILFLFIALFSIQSYAADNGDWWLQRNITLAQDDVQAARRIYVSSRKIYDVDDVIGGVRSRTVIKNVIVEDNPSKGRLGRVLLQRAKAVAGGNVAGVVGAAAVIALIEGVGWVMEEGTWVKRKQPEADDNCSSCTYYWRQQYQGTKKFPTYKTACPSTLGPSANTGGSVYVLRDNPYTINSLDSVTCHYKDRDYPNLTNMYKNPETYRSLNPNPQPAPEPIKITITDEDVGGIVTGDYVDPVDDSQNINDKKYKPVVVTAYEHDPSGVGEDIANETDERIKNAPPTPDGSPAPKGDTDYVTVAESDESTNDRSWENDHANEADGQSTPTSDPVTGEVTGEKKLSLTFPVFCEWAHSVCDWYDDWTATDTIYKEQAEKERTFWQKVTDFFAWVKEEPEQPEEPVQPEIDDQSIFDREFDTTFTLSNQCPPDIPISFESPYLSGNFTFSMNWLCIIFTFIGYPLVFLSHCIGIWILYEAAIQKQIKW